MNRNWTPLEERALFFATAAHAGQERKYTGEMYITHPIAVAQMVKEIGGDEKMVAAAFMHDVLEDTKVSKDLMIAMFGSPVADLVEMLTDRYDQSYGNRAKRKYLYCRQLANASDAAQTIKLADLIDNTSSIVKHDSSFAKVYLQEKRDMLLYGLTNGSRVLHDIACQSVMASQLELNRREHANGQPA